MTFRDPVLAPPEHLGGHFDTLGAPWEAILAPRDYPGGPWEQQDGFEVVNNRICVDLGVMIGRVYAVFRDKNAYKSRFCFELVSRSFFNGFLTQNVDVWDFQIVVFAWKVLHKLTFQGNHF